MQSRLRHSSLGMVIGVPFGGGGGGISWSSYWLTQAGLALKAKMAIWTSEDGETDSYLLDKIGVQEREVLTQQGIVGQVFPGRFVQFNGVEAAATRQLIYSLSNVPESYSTGTNSVSVSLWVKYETAPTVNPQFLYFGGGFTVFITKTSGKITVIASKNLTSSVNICDGEWHHILVIEHVTNRLYLFIDNILDGSDTLDNVPIYSAAKMGIGGHLSKIGYGAGNNFQMHDVRVFSKALLDENDRDNLYAGNYVSGCVGWWPLEEKLLNTAISSANNISGLFWDISGTGFHLSGKLLTTDSYIEGIKNSLLNKFGYAEKIPYPDLIQGDGTFDNAALWTTHGARWSITGGTATFLAADNYRLRNNRTIAFTVNSMIMMSFDISVGDTATIYPANQIDQPLAPSTAYGVGHHDIIFKPDYGGTQIAIWGVATGGAFTIDNLTFRFYYESPVLPLVDSANPTHDVLGNDLIFNGQAKYNLIKVDADTVKLPDKVGELFDACELITENDWYDANGVGNEIDLSNIAAYQSARQYYNSERKELIIIKADWFLTEVEDAKLQQYMGL